MREQNKKVIYYYYDQEDNRRPIFESETLLNDYKNLENKFPIIKNNFYAQIDGKEFKLL
ncbi:hypothetical protein [Staphylococcus haemolyticus]|nr:hypothetical protein [Staphylococcus haemolyticus]